MVLTFKERSNSVKWCYCYYHLATKSHSMYWKKVSSIWGQNSFIIHEFCQYSYEKLCLPWFRSIPCLEGKLLKVEMQDTALAYQAVSFLLPFLAILFYPHLLMDILNRYYSRQKNTPPSKTFTSESPKPVAMFPYLAKVSLKMWLRISK